MQVVQTPGLPPNQGRMNLLMTGWTWKSKKALRRLKRLKSRTESGREEVDIEVGKGVRLP
jgi:hypothetical protein